MNKKVIAVIILTIIALTMLMLISFGPLGTNGKSSDINPISQKPQEIKQNTINKNPVVFVGFHNKDVKENYYGINLPKDWQTKSGVKAGSYDIIFPEGKCEINLQDVPDNSTLELFILTPKKR